LEQGPGQGPGLRWQGPGSGPGLGCQGRGHGLESEGQAPRQCEHQMKGCVAEQKVSDWQMNAWTLRACDIV